MLQNVVVVVVVVVAGNWISRARGERVKSRTDDPGGVGGRKGGDEANPADRNYFYSSTEMNSLKIYARQTGFRFKSPAPCLREQTTRE